MLVLANVSPDARVATKTVLGLLIVVSVSEHQSATKLLSRRMPGSELLIARVSSAKPLLGTFKCGASSVPSRRRLSESRPECKESITTMNSRGDFGSPWRKLGPTWNDRELP